MGTAIDLQTRVDELAKRVDELSSREAIRDCICRINRGIDRSASDQSSSSRSSFTFGCSAGAVLGKGSPAGSNRRASPPR